jgi:hypothetical protein
MKNSGPSKVNLQTAAMISATSVTDEFSPNTDSWASTLKV